jgi:cytochrome c553
MKKLFFVVLVVVIVAGMAAAQTYTSGSGLIGADILGAHQNGGRGCAGCHAPHSGAAGGGGNAATNAVPFNDPLSGSNALFGQDVTPLLGLSITFGGGFVEALPGEAAAYSTQEDELRQITMCLACHDGVVAKGQMMNGQSWEQRMNLLPATAYGTRPIPTLLGNDSGNGNMSGYGNDHPVGTQATLGRARVWTNNATTSPTTITVDAVNGITNIAPNSAAYTSFVANYGYPSLAGSPWGWGVSIPEGDTNPADAFLTCTTCHNQHVMYVYQAPRGKQAGAAIVAGGTYPTYFFINAPFNPGAGNNSPTMAASATQFCRQCHFGEANENYGVTTVKTQF